jgi:hypothetical protein
MYPPPLNPLIDTPYSPQATLPPQNYLSPLSRPSFGPQVGVDYSNECYNQDYFSKQDDFRHPNPVFPVIQQPTYTFGHHQTIFDESYYTGTSEGYFQRDPFLYKQFVATEEEDPSLEYLGIGKIQVINLKPAPNVRLQ